MIHICSLFNASIHVTQAIHNGKQRSEFPPAGIDPRHYDAVRKIVEAELVSDQYASSNILQSYEAYVPDEGVATGIPKGSKPLEKYWLIFVHGGAWRDPTINATAFSKTRDLLLTSPWYSHAASRISGYASLNYRLSQHPSYPQDPRSTNRYHLRAARHPDHVRDIVLGIARLQKIYGFGKRYVLIGHSCGATIALQTLMGLPEVESLGLGVSGAWRMPAAVLAVDGIYDIPKLVKKFADIPEYRDSVVGAFGNDEKAWAHVSPARGDWLREGEWSRGSKRVMVIAHSHRDELVDWGQVDLMTKQVGAQTKNNDAVESANGEGAGAGKLEGRWDGYLKVIELKSTHHEVWEKGEELARAITETLHILDRLERGLDPLVSCIC